MPETLSPPPQKDRWLIFASPVLRKFSTGVTGLLLVLYLGQHLFANLRIHGDDPVGVSRYGHTLEGFGLLLRGIEIGLAVVLIFHAVMGIVIWVNKRKARPAGYRQYHTKGLQSKQTFASRSMIWGGLLLVVFLVIHVAWFRFGPGIAEGYAVQIEGDAARHYERLVAERFQHLGYVIFYCIAMIAVGLHLSHGVWSALQSVGLVNSQNREVLYRISQFLGAAIALGFISIPLLIYFA